MPSAARFPRSIPRRRVTARKVQPVCTRRSDRVIVPIKPIGAVSRDKFSAASAETSIATSLGPAKRPDNLNFEGLAGILGSVATGAASFAQKCVTCGFDSQARGLFSGGSPSMPGDGKWGAFVRNRFGAIQSAAACECSGERLEATSVPARHESFPVCNDGGRLQLSLQWYLTAAS